MVAREGYVIIGITLVLAAALSGITLLVSASWGILCLVAAVFITAGVLFFFSRPCPYAPTRFRSAGACAGGRQSGGRG